MYARYYDCAQYSDITIKVNGEEIKAHRLVLAQGSDYFKACLGGGFMASDKHMISKSDQN